MMRTVFIVAGAWISLFAGTALVSHLLRDDPSAHDPRGAPEAAALPDNGRDVLRSLPRRTQAELVELDDAEANNQYPEILARLHAAFASFAEPPAGRLRDC